MYLDYYGLRETPFSITPDPRFVFLSERHRDALAHLLYGVGQGGGGGFVQLTGEVGTGKTTLCRLLLEQLPENARVALVLNPKLSPVELLESIAEELKIDIDGKRGSVKALVDVLNAFLLDAYARGLRVVLIVDEAQNLSTEALEQIRLLTNLETATQKLLQIVLLGQPELRDVVAQPELRQLAQRITARYHLTPLDSAETESYLRHRLAVAGASRFPFTRLAVRRLHQHSSGIPRLINTIADRALMAGYAREEAYVGERLVDKAAAEVLASPLARWKKRPWLALAAMIVLTLALIVALWRLPRPAKPLTEETATAAIAENASNDAPPLQDAVALAQLADAGNASASAAWTRLLGRWKLRAERADVASAQRCPMVISPGVFCLRGGGTLAKLSALRRPAVLHLSAEGRDIHAVLLGLNDQRARLGLGGETVDVSRAELERLWMGEFHALWTTPEFVPSVLRRGDSGPGVEWLRQVLIQDGRLPPEAIGPSVFDAELENAVRTLQREFGLSPDGIAGPETLFTAASRADGGPRLMRTLK
ncbi:MAG: AAA family ATPase [Lysobacteraceae bacterium]